MFTININPKEYYRHCRYKELNKKHKTMREGIPRMDFNAYTSKIISLHEHKDIEKIKGEQRGQNRLQVINYKMEKSYTQKRICTFIFNFCS